MLILGLPIIQAQETTEGIFFDRMSMAHVSIQGSGKEFMIRESFTFGFGRCLFMRVTLEEDGHIHINKFLNISDVIDLDGSHVIYLIGFFGYYSHINKININGVAAQAIWK
jgi:hypothetical protein